MLLGGLAHAGVFGLWIDSRYGGGTSDATGELRRGNALNLGIGGYHGNYQGRYAYGQYWRYGLTSRIHVGQGLDDTLDFDIAVGPKLVRGADLLRLGVFWAVEAGPFFAARGTNVDELRDDEFESLVRYGAFARGSVGGKYNFSHVLAVTVGYELGLQYDQDGFSTTRGLAVGLVVRAPIVRTHWRDDELEPAVPSDARE